jgi:very-short-patch-repair endonuclease
MAGVKFRRQRRIGPYIVDFYCAEAGLAIEVDGSTHESPENLVRDQDRTDYLQARGVRIMRFNNARVLHGTEAVLAEIARAVRPSP